MGRFRLRNLEVVARPVRDDEHVVRVTAGRSIPRSGDWLVEFQGRRELAAGDAFLFFAQPLDETARALLERELRT
jgi:hypothetical protein